MSKMNFSLFLFITVSLFLGCSFVQPNVASDSVRENALTPSPTPEMSPKTIAEQNFEKDWKSKYQKTSSELKENRQKWQESNITNYDFVIAKYAGGVTNEWNRLPVLIKIRNGEKTSIEKVEKDKDYVIQSRTDGFEDFDTVNKLFDFIRRELDGGKIFEIEYDEKFGYPKSVMETLHYNHGHNYRTIEVSKFEIIKLNPDNRNL